MKLTILVSMACVCVCDMSIDCCMDECRMEWDGRMDSIASSLLFSSLPLVFFFLSFSSLSLTCSRCQQKFTLTQLRETRHQKRVGNTDTHTQISRHTITHHKRWIPLASHSSALHRVSERPSTAILSWSHRQPTERAILPITYFMMLTRLVPYAFFSSFLCLIA